MNTYILKLLISKLSYMFCMDGDIIPFVNVYPPFILPDGREISKFPLLQMQLLEDAAHVTTGDEVEVHICEDPGQGTPTIRITRQSEQPRINHLSNTCPICGSVLVAPTTPFSMGRCINRSCMAQISTNTLHFLSQMPLHLTPDFLSVLSSTISRGSVTSLFQLFQLAPQDLITVMIPYEDCQAFLYRLHSIRGITSLIQLIRGIRIPFWTEEHYVILENYMIDHDIGWNNYMEIFDLPNRADRPDLPWQQYAELFSVMSNYQLFNNLAWILLH